MKLKQIKEIIPLALIIILAVILRFLWLDRVPGAVGGDELNYILAAKSVALSGTDFGGAWNILPIIFFRYPAGFPQAELSYFLLYPASLFLNLSLITSKLTFAFISVLCCVAFYLLGRELFDKKTGLIMAALAAINPWQVFIGRTNYEMVPATLFYILGVYFVIREKGWRILIAAPFLFLAFYTYIAPKVAFLPIVIVVSVYAYFANKKKFGKQYVILNALCVALVGFFALSLFSGSGNSRGGDLFFPSSPDIVEEVDYIRKNSISPAFINSIFENKATVYFKMLADRVFIAFNPTRLFVATDDYASLYGHGFFYLIDALFLILGVMFLFVRNRLKFFLISGLITTSILPQLLYKTDNYFSPHLVLFYAFLLIPLAYGISETVKEYKSKIIPVVIFSIYLISFLNFLHFYFYRFPLVGHFDFASRTLSKYISLDTSKKVDVYTSGPGDVFKKYLFYTDNLEKENILSVKESVSENTNDLGNVRFYSCGDIIKTFDKEAVTIFQEGLCQKFATEASAIKIPRLDDGGAIYKIYNDRICSKYNLKPYPGGLKISDFSIEKLSEKDFCETFISR